ncbi:MAG: PhnD/SsuA/transferrin family substrate-binding protein [Burkholderiales bacterium]
MLRVGCLEYFDRVQALVDGRVRPEGVDMKLTILQHPGELFRKMVEGLEFDAGELSLSTYVIMRSRGDVRYTAIPVFLSRNFRHSYIFVNAASGISRPEDLRGKRVGIPEYQLTGAVWLRGLLQHEYGVHPREIHWVSNWNTDIDARGRAERLALDLPADVSIEDPGDKHSIGELLESGAIDAVIGSTVPACVRRGSPRVRRLFPNYADVEREYLRRTSIFPIMHLAVVRKEFCQSNPGLAQSLYDAFSAAKALGLARLRVTGHLACCLPWLQHSLDEAHALIGKDFWPYGIGPNGKALGAVLAYLHEQGLTRSLMEVAELFETVDETNAAYA